MWTGCGLPAIVEGSTSSASVSAPTATTALLGQPQRGVAVDAGLLVGGDEVRIGPPGQITGSDERHITPTYLHPLTGERLAQLVRRDRLVRAQGIDPADAGDIDQYPAGDQRRDLGGVPAQRAEVTQVPLLDAAAEPLVFGAAGDVRESVDVG